MNGIGLIIGIIILAGWILSPLLQGNGLKPVDVILPLICAGVLFGAVGFAKDEKTKEEPKQPEPEPWPEYMVGYHGTDSFENAISAIKEGFKPGPDSQYGPGLYISFVFDDAQTHATTSGVIVRFYLRKDMPLITQSEIPYQTWEERWRWCAANGYQGIYVVPMKWIVIPGQVGVPVNIPSLLGIDVVDYWGNPIDINPYL